MITVGEELLGWCSPLNEKRLLWASGMLVESAELTDEADEVVRSESAGLAVR